MKNVMKMFIAIAVMGVMTVSAFAQGAGPGGGKGGPGGGQRGPGGGGMRRMDMDAEVLAKLNLTAPQKTAVKALKDARAKKVQELMKTMGPGPGAGAGAGKGGNGGKAGAGKPGGPGGPGGPGAGMREKFKPIQDAYMAGLKKVLTPAQMTAYEKGVKEMREKMRAQFGGGKPGGPEGAGKGKGKGGTPPPSA